MQGTPTVETELLRARVEQLYTPLEEAVEELRRRRKDADLCAAVSRLYENCPPTFLSKEPVAMLGRCIISADNEFARFKQLAEAVGLPLLPLEIPGDRFYSFNPDKKRRAKLSFSATPTHNKNLTIVDFNGVEGKPFSDIATISGMPLVEFHHRLLAAYFPACACSVRDMWHWLHKPNQTLPYPQLLLGVTGGILFENFFPDDASEERILRERILPTADEIFRQFGVKPLIVRIFTPTEEREPWIWLYPGELHETAKSLLFGSEK